MIPVTVWSGMGHLLLALSRQAAIAWMEAGTLVLVAWVRSGEGKWEEAKAAGQQAIAIHRQAGNESGVASALTALGKVYAGLGQYGEAEGAYAEALALCRQTGHRIGAGQALTGLFSACYHQGELARAAAYARESLAVNRDVGDRLGLAIATHNLGFLAACNGRYREAVDHYHETLAIYETIAAGGARRSNTHRHLAESLLALDETAAAGDQLYQAIQTLPAAAYRQRGPDLLLVAAQLLLRAGEKALAAGILVYLQQHGLLPSAPDPSVSGLLAVPQMLKPVAIRSTKEGLDAVASKIGRCDLTS
jgi:tetratricopeptide (TPR) repeat protein